MYYLTSYIEGDKNKTVLGPLDSEATRDDLWEQVITFADEDILEDFRVEILVVDAANISVYPGDTIPRSKS